MSRFLNKETLLCLYYSLIYPYLTYCNEVWGLGYSTQRKKLFILQKRALRIISNKPKFEASNPLCKELHVLKLHDLNSYLITNFMFKVYHGDVPSIFQDMFILNSAIHSHNTRQHSELHVPRVCSNILKMSIRYAAVIIWNKASRSLNVNCTLNTFKKRLKGSIIYVY